MRWVVGGSAPLQCSGVLGAKDPQRAPEPCQVHAQLLHTLAESRKLLRTDLLLSFCPKGGRTEYFRPVLYLQRLTSPISACF